MNAIEQVKAEQAEARTELARISKRYMMLSKGYVRGTTQQRDTLKRYRDEMKACVDNIALLNAELEGLEE